MWKLEPKEGWMLKNWYFRLEKTLESLLDSKEINPVLKGNQPCITHWKDWCWSWSFNTLVTWCKQQRADSLWKDPDAGKYWGQEEKGAAEDKMVGWHHWLNGHEFEQTLGESKGQGSLACCSSWGHKELDTTWQLNSSNELVLVNTYGNPLQYCCLENSMDRGAWWATVHGVTKSQTWLST